MLGRRIVGDDDRAPADQLRGGENGERTGGIDDRAGRPIDGGADLGGEVAIVRRSNDHDPRASRERRGQRGIARPTLGAPGTPGRQRDQWLARV